MITLGQLIGDATAHRLATTGLHKIAANTLRSEGFNVGEELDLRSAVQALGTRVFLKNAEYRAIVDGLASLETLHRS